MCFGGGDFVSIDVVLCLGGDEFVFVLLEIEGLKDVGVVV